LGWRISRSSSTDELVYVNEYNEEEVSMLLAYFQEYKSFDLTLRKINDLHVACNKKTKKN